MFVGPSATKMALRSVCVRCHSVLRSWTCTGSMHCRFTCTTVGSTRTCVRSTETISPRPSWSVQDLESWLLDMLQTRREVTKHYDSWQPGLFKDDLRTATFVVRRGDDQFIFAHTSLREYFYARRLVGALVGTDVDVAVDAGGAVRASVETLDFVGQLVRRMDVSTRVVALDRLEHLAAKPASALLAFRYAVAAGSRKYPAHRLASTRLSGADLGGIQLADIDLHGVALRDCTGRIGSDAGLVACHTEVIRSDPLSGEHQDVLIAPLMARRDARQLRTFLGHTDGVWSVAWSPDGSQMVSGSADGSVRMWSVGTGEPVGWRLETRPSGNVAVGDATSGELLGASEGAWRWLGWQTPGRMERLPAECFGRLPGL